jgi:hypothetical protein
MQNNTTINKNLYNNKGQRHGYWETYWNNNKLWAKSFYINDNIYGYVEFNTNKIIDKYYCAK